jgi:hypothetical protein
MTEFIVKPRRNSAADPVGADRLHAGPQQETAEGSGSRGSKL